MLWSTGTSDMRIFPVWCVCLSPKCAHLRCILCVVQGIEVVVTLHRWWECFLFIYLFIWGGGGGEAEWKRELRQGGLRLRCCYATVTRAAVIGLHIEGFCGAAGWANSQLDLSDGIQSSSLPSLLCSFLLSLPLSAHHLWRVYSISSRFTLLPSLPSQLQTCVWTL